MHERRYKFLDMLVTAFVVVLLVSNLLAQKICKFGPFVVSAAILLFPITYIFADIFTEVYGYAASRRAIWLGFFATGLLSLMGLITIALPSAPGWTNQQAFVTVFGFLPRIFAASLAAYWAGEFANSYTLSRMKLLTNGRWLWTRTIGSTIVGQAVDTALVIVLTFGGKYPWGEIVRIVLSGYVLKVLYETLATPLTYAIVIALKRSEGVDVFDRAHDYNPFSLAMPELKS